MNASERPSGRGDSPVAGCCILSLVALLILVGQIVFSVVTYPLLPDPSQWSGVKVTGTTTRIGFVMSFIGINIGVFLFLQFLRVVVRLADRSEGQVGDSIVSIVALLIVAVNLANQVFTTGAILHW